MEQMTLPLTQDPVAVVVFSGGQDSTVCLAEACRRHGPANVRAIAFRYGQRHVIEYDCAVKIAVALGVDLHVIDLDFMPKVVNSALTGNEAPVDTPHADNPRVPASFVPARNALFLTIAHGYAQKVHAQLVYAGVCEADYSGYPDCRQRFVTALEVALNIGYNTDIRIVTPLMYLTKAEIFARADSLGILPLLLEHSHTCYEGDHTNRHDWGYGCGKCPACRLRRKGWENYLEIRKGA